MASFPAESGRKNVSRVTMAYTIVGGLVILVSYLLLDRYVLNAPRPPFAGAEVDPDSLDSPVDAPPVPTALKPAPPSPNE